MGNKIIVTGGSGLVGTHLKKYLPNAIYLTSKDYNLCNEFDVNKLFLDHSPNIIIHLASKVGGIIDNIEKPAEYFTDNILMNTLLLKYSYKYGVSKFIGMLSTCIYPDIVEEYPLTEDMLHNGPPTETNFSYGYAKRCMSVQIDSYNKQYGTKWNYLIPCNLFGEGDKSGNNSHFVTALLNKIKYANDNNLKEINLFGDGTPLRQFMYVDDLCYVITKVIENDITESFNVATDEVYSIDEIAKIAIKATGSKLKIKYDKTKPNGQHRKDVSIDKMISYIDDLKITPLKEGLKNVYKSL